MIVIKIFKESENIDVINVTGHSSHVSENNNDLACAGVSTIMFGTANVLMNYGSNKKDISIKDNEIEFKIEKTKEQQIIANACLIQLLTVKNEYKQYITMEEK